MSSEKAPVKVSPAEVRGHEAASALASVFGPSVTVTGIQQLEVKRKTRVYRLEVLGAPFQTVVAKWKSYDDAGEKVFYEHFLPSAGLPMLRIYGDLKRPQEGSFWRFLEDAGEHTVSDSYDDRRLTARWLTALHMCEGLDRFALPLHDRGPNHYFWQLRSAHEVITTHLANEFIDEKTRRSLQHIVAQLDKLDRRWHRVRDLCADAPRTLVHGDLARKNARIRRTPKGIELVVLDWEMAGVGPPSIDLAQGLLGSLTPDLPCYVSGMKAVWPAVTLDRVNTLATIGRIFRLVAALHWQARKVRDPRCANFPVYELYGSEYELYGSELELAMQSDIWRSATCRSTGF